MKPVESPLIYTLITEVDLVDPKFFALDGMNCFFHCEHNLHLGDKVKVIIQKVPPDAKPE